MNTCRPLLVCVLASLCAFSFGAQAQVVTEFSAGISPGTPVASRLVPTATCGSPSRRRPDRPDHHDRHVTEFSAGITAGRTHGITAGPDGNLWFTESTATGSGGSRPPASSPSSAPASPPARTSTTSRPAPTATSGSPNQRRPDRADHDRRRRHRVQRRHHRRREPDGIAAGPDGNLWFTEIDGNRIGRITPTGVVTEFSAGITAGAGPSASRPAPTAICGSRNLTATGSARSHRAVWSPIQRGHHGWRAPSPASRRARMATCGSPNSAAIGSGASPRSASSPSSAPASRRCGPRRHCRRPGRQPVVHGNQRQPDRPHYHRRLGTALLVRRRARCMARPARSTCRCRLSRPIRPPSREGVRPRPS